MNPSGSSTPFLFLEQRGGEKDMDKNILGYACVDGNG
jgi:hypothetical protein